MLEWLKYFFGNFFIKKYAEQSERRSWLNGLLSFFLSMVMVFGAFVLGTGWAFPSHYARSSEFAEYYHGLFVGDNALSLALAEGKMSAATGDEYTINTYLSETDAAKYADGKYNLIVDTREIGQLYNDCHAEFVNKTDKNDVLTYEQYTALDEKTADNYSARLVMTENVLELTAENVASYAEFVSQNGTDEQKNTLAELQTDGVVPAENYGKVYELYYAAKYAKFGTSFTRVPMMRNYYISTYLAINANGSSVYDNYVIILRDIAFFAWHTDSNQMMSVTGYYGEDSLAIGGKNVTAQADKLVTSLYAANTNAVSINYFMYLSRSALTLVFVQLVLVVLATIIGFIAKSELLGSFSGLFKTSGAFWLGATIPTVLFILIGEFFLSQTYVFYLALGVELMTMLVRSVAHYVPLFIEESRKKKEEAAKAEQQNDANA